jgi:hypothetical protein
MVSVKRRLRRDLAGKREPNGQDVERTAANWILGTLDYWCLYLGVPAVQRLISGAPNAARTPTEEFALEAITSVGHQVLEFFDGDSRSAEILKSTLTEYDWELARARSCKLRAAARHHD